MPYKISGSLSESTRIIIINNYDWSIESNTVVSESSFLIDSMTSGTKTVIGLDNNYKVIGYGNIDPIYYSDARGMFAGGSVGGPTSSNTIDYVSISTIGDAADFGDMTQAKRSLAATSNGSNDRGIFGGGSTGSDINNIDYITMSNAGNATDFGDITLARRNLAATSNGVNNKGVFGGGYSGSSYVNNMDYITISTMGDANDFGDLLVTLGWLSATSNGANDRGIFGGGNYAPSTYSNVINYITISTNSDATDFGDMISPRYALTSTSNGINDRGVFAGGYTTGSVAVNIIDYITISTTGNATDFGDMVSAIYSLASTSNGTGNRGIFGGGYISTYINIIDYITISTIGDAQDFGDLTIARNYLSATSNA